MGRLSQADVAAKITAKAGVDVDSDRLSRIESGKEVKFYEAIAILRALRDLDPEGRGYDWLIGTDPLPIARPQKPSFAMAHTVSRVKKDAERKRNNGR